MFCHHPRQKAKRAIRAQNSAATPNEAGEAPIMFCNAKIILCNQGVTPPENEGTPRHQVLLSRSFGKYHYFNWTYLIVSAAHVSQVSRSQQRLRRRSPRLPSPPSLAPKAFQSFQSFQYDLLNVRIFSSTFVSDSISCAPPPPRGQHQNL